MLKHCLVALVLAFSAFTSLAEEAVTKQQQPLINVDMTLDLDGMEHYAEQATQSLESISDSLQAIVDNPNLSDDQKQALDKTINSVNQLTLSTTQTLRGLPDALEQSRVAFKQTSQTLMDDLQFKLIVVLCAIVLVIVLALVAIYLLILKPMQQTLVRATGNISSMAQSIQITAEALKVSTEKQQQIMDFIEIAETKPKA
ncbi:GTP-binding protein [Vibrio breoganii]|uniref:GTP-binding protein n=1 Tax=Vibrio breoganii TaxID=553239 RepID=A0ABX1U5L4_9VIBR|nr:GTP-binding protein [Vibrio breoganii]NMO74764.1 GTP-binding protein [Vibrio breoganii]NMR68690.1 GTP-binding protein [Vibrio breoganii]PMH13377.1 GTP-binding protein [Vibrio breoganii]PML87789.1 GTP-binding protein [Vibrio breoganii]PMM12151.1 GTP-binding protein [Vibrio breoganii]